MGLQRAAGRLIPPGPGPSPGRLPASPQLQQVMGRTNQGGLTGISLQPPSLKPPEALLFLHLAKHRLHQHPSLFVEGPPPFREQLTLHPLPRAQVLGDTSSGTAPFPRCLPLLPVPSAGSGQALGGGHQQLRQVRSIRGQQVGLTPVPRIDQTDPRTSCNPRCCQVLIHTLQHRQEPLQPFAT